MAELTTQDKQNVANDPTELLEVVISGGNVTGFINFPSALEDEFHHIQIEIRYTNPSRTTDTDSPRIIDDAKFIKLPTLPISSNFNANWSVISYGAYGDIQRQKLSMDTLKNISKKYENIKFGELVTNPFDNTVIDNTGEFMSAIGEAVLPYDYATQYPDALNAVAISAAANIFTPVQAMLVNSGTAVRNFQSQKFDIMGFRNFTFSWRLVASNANESETLKTMEKILKMGMHPRLTNTLGTMVSYPATYLLSFNRKKSDGSFEENTYLPKIGPCVLTSLSFNYNSMQSAFFQDTKAPTEVTISMAFTETELNTSENFSVTDVNDPNLRR